MIRVHIGDNIKAIPFRGKYPPYQGKIDQLSHVSERFVIYDFCPKSYYPEKACKDQDGHDTFLFWVGNIKNFIYIGIESKIGSLEAELPW